MSIFIKVGLDNWRDNMRSKLRKITVIILSIILIIIVASGCEEKKSFYGEEAIAVEVYQVKLDGIHEIVTISGQLMPATNAMIIPLQPGLKITNLTVKLGDKVRKGDFLFELDKALVRKQIEQAKGNYDFARRNLSLQREALQQMETHMVDIETTQQQGILQTFSNIQGSSYGGRRQ